MNLTNEETDLTRWIDGELSEDEAARLLAEHPEWEDQRAAAAVLGDQLRASVPLERELPHADFFHHQIRRRIEGDIFDAEAPESPLPTAEEESSFRPPLFQRLRWLSAAGFVVTFGALVAFVLNQTPDDRSEVVSTYTPNPDVSVITTYHPGAEATIIQLIGAPDIPAHSSASLSLPRTLDRVLFELDSQALGRPISVLSGEADGDQMPGAVLVGF